MQHDRSAVSPPVPVHGERRPAVVIAAEHPRIRSSLFGVLSTDGGFSQVTGAADLVRAVRLLRRSPPDIVLVDRAILGAAGLRRVPMLRTAAPEAAVLIAGMGDHSGYERAARAAGAAGYLRLDQAPEELGRRVRAACSAGCG